MSLTVVPLGGLCNRLRALLSSLALAERSGIRVQVEWGCDEECRAWFEDLFHPVEFPGIAIVHRPWWNRPARKRNLFLPALARKLAGYRLQWDCYVPNEASPLPVGKLALGKNYLSTGLEFLPYPRSLTRLLRPLPFLQSRIDRIRERFAARTVGVHIRRTDNRASISNSPVEAFRRAIDREIASDGEVKFFLATDDERLKLRLQTEYPGRFIVQLTNVRRDTFDGMCEAVVDLYCLASTCKLLGSYWSSFTDTAAELGNVPVEIIRA